MNSRPGHPGKPRGFSHRVALVVGVLAASLWFAPGAFAHTHVGFGISIGVGNCWNCGYRAVPPVYYAPAYPPPVYYPPTVYYAPPPAYYGYGYYTPRPAYYGYGYYGYYAPRHYRRHDFDDRRGYYGHRDRDDRWGYYRHGHR
ncbi:MAG TPA: hypothetical protein VJ862_05810 [Rhodanobacteraceae bacterium]|nr:hypothetical protein [Rhodanobacteraceae bacterium]